MGKKVTLEQLERLSADGDKDALKAALTQCLFEDLRRFLNALDVKVRSKQYAAYRTKEDHVQLLADVLEKKNAEEEDKEVDPVASPQQEEDGEKSSEEEEELVETRQDTTNESTEEEEAPLEGPLPSNKDAERAFLVQCINKTSDVLTNVEKKKEQVPDLKRTLTSELAYYVKRLKRIQEKDGSVA